MKKAIIALTLAVLVLMGGHESVRAETTENSSLLSQLESLTAAVNQLQKILGGNTTTSQAEKLYNSSVAFGNNNESIKILQTVLASDPIIYPEGLITGYFGTLTESALRNFQKKFGLDETGTFNMQTGYVLTDVFSLYPIAVGDTTYLLRAEVKAAILTAKEDYLLQPTIVMGKVAFSSNPVFKTGNINSDVATLQRILATDYSLYPENNISGEFDGATVAAVSRYQAKYGLPVSGVVDAVTLKSLNSALVKNNASVIKTGLLLGISGPASVPTPPVTIPKKVELDMATIKIDYANSISTTLSVSYTDGTDELIGSATRFGTDFLIREGNKTKVIEFVKADTLVDYGNTKITLEELQEIIADEAYNDLPVNKKVIKLLRKQLAIYFGVDESDTPNIPVTYSTVNKQDYTPVEKCYFFGRPVSCT